MICSNDWTQKVVVVIIYEPSWSSRPGHRCGIKSQSRTSPDLSLWWSHTKSHVLHPLRIISNILQLET